MATEKKINTILKEAGYNPMEGRAIIVTYAPANLSEKITRFFSNDFLFCRCVRILWCWCRLAKRAERVPFLRNPGRRHEWFKHRCGCFRIP